ncbi:hypothetical protein DMH15_14735 [Streptomyces sp. WAC 06725]|uniref:DesA/ISL3 alpha bundle tail domain-containing protein n=1 Tax=Streptomyces sp. WAC 06725 TaxID=2203209 RepID=UPI000F744AE5|nr:transposase [Streptomyces sp. WAC 06725]RSO40620.1 hypothetical protein DMH15_14735 [Streptomyces sp. WAC 06725]
MVTTPIVAALFRELAARGFGGSEATVRLYVTDHREALDRAFLLPLRPVAPSISRLLMSRPDHLPEDQRVFVKELLQRCPELHTTHQLIRAFATVFDKRRPAQLDDWIRRARTCGNPQLRIFAAGLLDLVAHSRRTPPRDVSESPWAINAHEILV